MSGSHTVHTSSKPSMGCVRTPIPGSVSKRANAKRCDGAPWAPEGPHTGPHDPLGGGARGRWRIPFGAVRLVFVVFLLMFFYFWRVDDFTAFLVFRGRQLKYVKSGDLNVSAGLSTRILCSFATLSWIWTSLKNIAFLSHLLMIATFVVGEWRHDFLSFGKIENRISGFIPNQ